MNLQKLVAAIFLASLAGTTAHAQDSGRYRLEKSADGYVRMDTQTGAMSICEEKTGQLVCRMAADERSAFQDEVDRLQASMKALDARVAKLETSLSAKLESSLPSEEDFNTTLSYMERFFRRFMGIVKDMEKNDGGETGKAVPEKT